MRRRDIDPAFFSSDQVIHCSIPARLMFIGLWCLADREGRLRDEPNRIRRQLFPDDRLNAETLLTELVTAGLLDRYVVSDERLLCIPAFATYQSIHPHEAQSKLAPPPRDRDMSLHASPKDANVHRLIKPSVNQALGVSSPSVSPQTPQGVADFVETWNAHCSPLPTLRKPPTRPNEVRLMTSAVEYFDGDVVLLGAAIKRAAGDEQYGIKRYGFETFCRHLAARWGEPVVAAPPENAIDRRIREASERGRHAGVTGTVIEMPMAAAHA